MKIYKVLSNGISINWQMKMTDESMTWKDALELFKLYRSLAGENSGDVKIIDTTITKEKK
jgi:hypothetical protein